jgi:hypothetical protein
MTADATGLVTVDAIVLNIIGMNIISALANAYLTRDATVLISFDVEFWQQIG